MLFRSEELVIVRDIEVFSQCEHHLTPFHGVAHVGYIPNGKITGLSKIARLVDVFARRPQVQERLTSQIADAMVEILDCAGVIVMAGSTHALSPEWIPASSICSIIPARNNSSPSYRASTSISIASSRNLSIHRRMRRVSLFGTPSFLPFGFPDCPLTHVILADTCFFELK